MNIEIANTEDQISSCKDALFAFRPNLEEKTYIKDILLMIKEEKFQLAYILNSENNKAIAIVGYRVMYMLRTGWIIYIDDLFTHPNFRDYGFAGALLRYVEKEAEKIGINAIHLDSGYMLHDAHRLYLNNGFVLSCNHFTKELKIAN